MQEPRGNAGILALLVPPLDPKADYGLIFCDYRGYVDMCIHGTIGVVTTLFECGLVDKEIQRRGEIKFETSAGLVSTKANFSKDRVESVSINNVTSFLLDEKALNVSGYGEVLVSIAFGGNFYGYVNADDVGLKIEPPQLQSILSAGRVFLKELGRLKVAHPETKKSSEIVGVCFYEDLGKNRSRNIMIAESDLFDRSPCGTGTCGRMAILHAKGKFRVGETFRNQSILSTEFRGTILKQTKVGSIPAIVPQVTGSAYLTGISDIIVSDGDKLGRGFLLTR